MGLVEKTFRNGEVIIKEGDSGKSFFLIEEGSAFVYAGSGKEDQVKLAVLEAGEFFGEMSILEAYPRSATIVAKGNVTAVEIPGDEMNAFFEEHPEMIIELIRHLVNRVQAMETDYNESKVLLEQLRASDSAKKNQSLFSKIKKHIDMYQSNKNKMNEPSEESRRKAFEGFKDDGTGKLKEYRKGMIVHKEGAVDNCMYILHSGRICFYTGYRTRDENKTGEIEAVTFFGEMGMLAEEPRSATAVAEADKTVIEFICPEDLETVFRSCPAKIEMILRQLSYRLRRLNIDFLSICKEITEIYNRK